ncbi:MAG: hypothetical protein JO340_12930 [Acidobacteriaceae bacterium]|nr:hypothetical protein [Acidobacteriaceae bacterium]
MPHRRSSGARITRRQWTAFLGVSPLLAQVTQKIPPEGAPQPASPAATPEQKRQAAFAEIHQSSQLLAQIDVPMNVEPAFAFRP